MTFADQELSDHLEGLAPAELSERIESALASSPELRGRLEDLRELLPRRLELEPVPLPPGLASRLVRHLEGEGLVEAPSIPVPEGLLERTLARAESLGLVASTSRLRGSAPVEEIPARPVARPGLVLLDSRRATGWGPSRVAAVAFLALGVGVVAGFTLRGERVVEVARVEKVEVEKRVEVPVEKIVRVEVPVEKRVEVEKIVRVEVPRDVVRDVVREVRVEVPVDREVVREVRVPSEPPVLEVADAHAVERWEPGERRWVALAGKASLPAGTVVRGQGQASFSVGTRHVRLSSGLYLVSERRTLESLPEGELAQGPAARAPASVASGAEPEARSVPGLLALRATGLPDEQARAQTALEAAYARIGDPGPSVLSSLTAFVSREPGPARGVPTTAEGWRAWWARAGGK